VAAVPTLSDLLRPTTVGSFLDDTWGRAPGVFRHDPGGDPLLTLDGFERMLASLNRAHEGWLQLARGGRRVVPAEMVDADGLLDLRQVRAAFRDGETLYLTKAHRLSPSLMRLGRSVEVELAGHGVALRSPVSAHVFLTPPGSQGFPPHQDEHGSIVVQLDGSKEWAVHPPAATGEVRRPGGVDLLALGPPTAYRLDPGDVLYVPEWWAHEARTSSSHSLHVTLRAFPLRWADLVAGLCEMHPGLREALPRGVAGNPKALTELVVELLGSRAFLDPLPGQVEAEVRRRSMPSTVLPDDGLRQQLLLDRIGPDTRLVRSAGMVAQVVEDGGAVTITFPGGAIRGPAALRDVFDEVAASDEVRAADLPLPPGDDDPRLDVVRRMVRDGLLRLADDPGRSR